MMRTRRALYITRESTTLDDGSSWPTPVDVRDRGLSALLDRLAAMFQAAGEGAAILDRDLSWLLGLVDQDGKLTARPDHPAVVEWSDWCTFRRKDHPTLRIAVEPLIDRSKSPIWADDPGATVAAMSLWHALTGRAYHGIPGMAGTTLLRDLAGTGAMSPTWKPQTTPVVRGEDDYHTDQWRAPRSQKAFAHGLDAHRAYIAAAANVEVARARLKPGPKSFDLAKHRHLAGWWEVELADWTDPRLPHPAGYDPSGKGRTVRWVTTPTMILLAELDEEGIYGGAHVLQSYVAQGSTVLRAWAWRMRDAYAGKDPDGRPVPARAEDLDRVRQTLKLAGRQVLGLLASESNWIYRPDWWRAVIAMDRCNRWRKMRRTGVELDIWPGWVDVDNVWYPTDEADWRKVLPEKFADGSRAWPIDQTGIKLGHFKHSGTRKSKRTKE